MGLSKSEILPRLQQLTGIEFERFIAELWELRGLETVVTAASGDRGIDIVAERSNPYSEKILIQTKRYSDATNVKGPEIQQYHSTRDQRENVDKVVVVTTSGFTDQAIDLGQDLNVKLINGNSLADLIKEMGAGDIVRKYTSPPSDAGKAPRDTLDTPSEEVSNQEVKSLPYDESNSLAAELTGIRWAETEITKKGSGLLSTNEIVEFAGYIATFRLFGRDQEWESLIEMPEEVSFITESGQKYHPMTLSPDAVPTGWQTHVLSGVAGRPDAVEIPKNSQCKYFSAVTVPRSSDIDRISIDRHEISFDLSDELSYQMRNLPMNIEELG